SENGLFSVPSDADLRFQAMGAAMSLRTLTATIWIAFLGAGVQAQDAAPGYRIQLDTIHRGYDGKTCWVHPRAGTIPGERPIVVLTMQKLLLTGSDVF